ncbi:MAG: tRNA lysidine(34) synthetase TilS [Verrucomicrobiota bacterium]
MLDLTSCLEGLSKTRRYLVGVSGGRDSVCLLDILIRSGFKKLVVVHVNHRLRGRAASGDATFTKRLADSYHLDFEKTEVDTKAYAKSMKLSVETAARNLRYEFFSVKAKKLRCSRILLAHHADDQVETVFMNLCRGSGTAGLGGMKTETTIGNLTVYRPLLNVWRTEIDAYISEHGLKFREDASNANDEHVRNRVRNELIPALPKVFGRDPREAILRAAQLCREDAAFLEMVVDGLYKVALTKSGGLRFAKVESTEPSGLKRRLIQRWLSENEVPDCGFAEAERVLTLMDIENGPAKVNLPGDWHARRRAGSLFLEPPARG